MIFLDLVFQNILNFLFEQQKNNIQNEIFI